MIWYHVGNNNANYLHLGKLHATLLCMMKLQTDSRYAKQLRDAGFKATSSKIELLSILANSKEPLAVGTIFSSFKSTKPDMATVYRSLKELHLKGLIRQINLQHSHAHYEYTRDTDHHHFVCNDCGLVEDIKNCDLSPVVKKALKESKFFKEVSDHSFELFGRCKGCRK